MDKQLSFELGIKGLSDSALQFEQLNLWIKNTKREFDELSKLANKGFASNEQLLRLAEVRKRYTELNTQQKEMVRTMNAAEGSLAKMRAELIRLKENYANASEEVAKGMIPQINKLTADITRSEQAIGVYGCNVGNYPFKQVAGGFREIAGTIGGVAGETGNLIAQFVTAGGVTGVLTAAIGLLAKAWKDTRENVELYLKSADKIKYGPAGFEVDAETARKDARRRGEGEVAEGMRIAGEYNGYLLRQRDLSAETVAYYKEMVVNGEKMILNGRKMITDTYGIKNKIEWERKYNQLLQEQEEISDEKLAKASEFEGLESSLMELRAIASDKDSSALQIKEASLKAEEIAEKLAGEKILLTNKEIDNLTAIAKMTGTEEALEDRINGLLKERNTITREYYGDILKANRMGKTADRIGNKTGKEDMAANNAMGWLEAGASITPYNADASTSGLYGGMDAEAAAEQKKQDEINRITEEGLKAGRELYRKNNEEAREEKRKSDEMSLTMEQEYQNAKLDIISTAAGLTASLTDAASMIFGKNKTMLAAGLIAERAYSIAEVVIKSAASRAAMTAWGTAMAGPTAGASVAFALGMNAKSRVQEGLSIAQIIAAGIAGIAGIGGAKYAIGGYTRKGSKYEPAGVVHAGEWVATKEMVESPVTGPVISRLERSRLSMRGSGVMRDNPSLYGYASGGYTQLSPPVLSGNFNNVALENMISRFEKSMNDRIDRIEVNLPIHKINQAQHELRVIEEPQKI